MTPRKLSDIVGSPPVSKTKPVETSAQKPKPLTFTEKHLPTFTKIYRKVKTKIQK